MNIMIDYDFVNAIKDINEKFGPIKVIRNNKNIYLKISIPMLTLLCYITFKEEFIKKIPLELAVYGFLETGFEMAVYTILGDIYKDHSANKLNTLPSLLKNLNIDTTNDLIKEADCYHRIYNLKLNSKKLPQIIESKYILLPAYNYNGDVVDVSILQEHVLGTHEYVLSLGEPQKVPKLAYRGI